MTSAAREKFNDSIAAVATEIADRPLDPGLEAVLNDQFGPDSALFAELANPCRAGVEEGWLCAREHGGIKFGRVIKPGGIARSFSVDVVEMDDVVGPHHRHPNGEIDMIMPIEGDARFDDRGRGWLVYGPGTAHHPSVTGGKAIVLYLLPDGAIEFTGQ